MTVFVPVPELVVCIHEFVVVAVQAQLVPDDTRNEVDPPEAPIEALEGERE